MRGSERRPRSTSRASGAHRFAQAGEFVGEGHRERQPRVDAVFGHLRGLGAHPEDFLAERREQRLQRRADGRRARADDDPLRVAENVQRLAQTQVFRAVRERDARMPPFQFAARAGGKLGRDEHDRTRPQGRQAPRDPVEHVGHVGHVVVVHRGVVTNPEYIRRPERRSVRSLREPQPPGADALPQGLVQTRLKQRGRARTAAPSSRPQNPARPR